jgi:membrane protease YdiL (CAAX protease family)
MNATRWTVGAGLAGTALLGAAMTREAGSRSFHVLAWCVAGSWVAGALAGGPELSDAGPAGRPSGPVVVPLLAGAASFGGFAALAELAGFIPPVDRAVRGALGYGESGSAPAVLASAGATAVAEEMFFRGRIWSLTRQRHPVLATTFAHAAATSATRNPALVAAALVMGPLFGWQRRTTGGIRAPLITHLTWSALMVRVLPRLRGRGRG